MCNDLIGTPVKKIPDKTLKNKIQVLLSFPDFSKAALFFVFTIPIFFISISKSVADTAT
jgi:hypothetical protein